MIKYKIMWEELKQYFKNIGDSQLFSGLNNSQQFISTDESISRETHVPLHFAEKVAISLNFHTQMQISLLF